MLSWLGRMAQRRIASGNRLFSRDLFASGDYLQA
jgi:hypothetical protein